MFQEDVSFSGPRVKKWSSVMTGGGCGWWRWWIVGLAMGCMPCFDNHEGFEKLHVPQLFYQSFGNVSCSGASSAVSVLGPATTPSRAATHAHAKEGFNRGVCTSLKVCRSRISCFFSFFWAASLLAG